MPTYGLRHRQTRRTASPLEQYSGCYSAHHAHFIESDCASCPCNARRASRRSTWFSGRWGRVDGYARIRQRHHGRTPMLPPDASAGKRTPDAARQRQPELYGQRADRPRRGQLSGVSRRRPGISCCVPRRACCGAAFPSAACSAASLSISRAICFSLCRNRAWTSPFFTGTVHTPCCGPRRKWRTACAGSAGAC